MVVFEKFKMPLPIRVYGDHLGFQIAPIASVVKYIIGVLASSAVDHGFKPWSGKIKDYEIGIGCFSTKHTALRSKSKD